MGEQKQAEQPAEAEAEAEVDEKAEVDSIDSLICACGFSMLMRFSHAYARGLQERTESDTARMTMIQRIWQRG
jgi:hypothetical protein